MNTYIENETKEVYFVNQPQQILENSRVYRESQVNAGNYQSDWQYWYVTLDVFAILDIMWTWTGRNIKTNK